jgi:hemoglobin
MYAFWFSVLFENQSYSGSSLQKDVDLDIKNEQFDRWLMLFIDTVDENFTGARAEKAKTQAIRIMAISQFSTGIFR